MEMSGREGLGSCEQRSCPKRSGGLGSRARGFGLSLQMSEGVCLVGRIKGRLQGTAMASEMTVLVEEKTQEL